MSDSCETKPTESKPAKRNYRNNFMQPEFNNAASKEEISSTLQSSTQWGNFPKVQSDEECADRINKYFQHCIDNGEIPMVEDMALALGVDRRRVWDWEQGKLGPDRMDIIKKAKEIIASFDAKMAAKGKMNPVLYIFRGKNYYGLKDETEHIISAQAQDRPKSPEELDKLILPPAADEE